jgi:hypothetical protein
MAIRVLPFLLLAFTAIYAGGSDTSGVTEPCGVYDDGSIWFSPEVLSRAIAADSGNGGHYKIVHYGGKLTEIFIDKDKTIVRFKKNYSSQPQPVPASVSQNVSISTNYKVQANESSEQIVFDPASKTYVPFKK